MVKTKQVELVVKNGFLNLAKNLVNFDFDVNDRWVPLTKESKLSHEWMGYVFSETWKLWCKKLAWTGPYWGPISMPKLTLLFGFVKNLVSPPLPETKQNWGFPGLCTQNWLGRKNPQLFCSRLWCQHHHAWMLGRRWTPVRLFLGPS